jgi:hypothetical protein
LLLPTPIIQHCPEWSTSLRRSCLVICNHSWFYVKHAVIQIIVYCSDLRDILVILWSVVILVLLLLCIYIIYYYNIQHWILDHISKHSILCILILYQNWMIIIFCYIQIELSIFRY